jgi:hypothetical protein
VRPFCSCFTSIVGSEMNDDDVYLMIDFEWLDDNYGIRHEGTACFDSLIYDVRRDDIRYGSKLFFKDVL